MDLVTAGIGFGSLILGVIAWGVIAIVASSYEVGKACKLEAARLELEVRSAAFKAAPPRSGAAQPAPVAQSQAVTTRPATPAVVQQGPKSAVQAQFAFAKPDGVYQAIAERIDTLLEMLENQPVGTPVTIGGKVAAVKPWKDGSLVELRDLRGITVPVVFPGIIAAPMEGDRIVVQGTTIQGKTSKGVRARGWDMPEPVPVLVIA